MILHYSSHSSQYVQHICVYIFILFYSSSIYTSEIRSYKDTTVSHCTYFHLQLYPYYNIQENTYSRLFLAEKLSQESNRLYVCMCVIENDHMCFTDAKDRTCCNDLFIYLSFSLHVPQPHAFLYIIHDRIILFYPSFKL